MMMGDAGSKKGEACVLLRKTTHVEGSLEPPVTGAAQDTSNSNSQLLWTLPVRTLTFACPNQSQEMPSLGCRIDCGDVVKVVIPEHKPKSYSMSAARPGEFDITFKVYPGGRCSGYLESVKVGESVLAFAKGKKKRNLGVGITHVGVVAFGVGITEGLPIAEAELLRGEAERVHLVWAARTHEDMVRERERERERRIGGVEESNGIDLACGHDRHRSRVKLEPALAPCFPFLPVVLTIFPAMPRVPEKIPYPVLARADRRAAAGARPREAGDHQNFEPGGQGGVLAGEGEHGTLPRTVSWMGTPDLQVPRRRHETDDEPGVRHVGSRWVPIHAVRAPHQATQVWLTPGVGGNFRCRDPKASLQGS